MTNVEGTTPAPAPNIPRGVPLTDPAVIARLVKRDKFLLRWFNFSYMSYIIGKAAHRPPVPTLLLITKGRKSGRWVEQGVFYFRHRKNYAVIGSNGGALKHPAWVLNLLGDPACKIHTYWRTHHMRARVAAGEERSQIWATAVQTYPNFIDYQIAAAEREIPVIVLEKRYANG